MKSKLFITAVATGIFLSTAYAQVTPSGITTGNASPAITNLGNPSPNLEVTPWVQLPVLATYINDLLVYPNPVISNTRIALDVIPVSDVFVDILDMNGRVDRTFQYAPGTNLLDVDMSRLPMGLYSVRVSGKDIGFHNLKVVKE